MSWASYKGLQVPSSSTGDAGINLTSDLELLADRAVYMASADPTVSDDSTDGFAAGSLWLNTSSLQTWQCINPVAGAAVWSQVIQVTSGSVSFNTPIAAGTWNGTAIAVAHGGTGANLSSTGGVSQVLQQTSAGGAVTVGQLSTTNISGAATVVVAQWATAAILPNTPTYNNGTSGVGATLTAGSNSTLTVDGGTVALNDLVLVNNQATASQNGLYVCTTAGSGSVKWVLTRSTLLNTGTQFVNAEVQVLGTGAANANSSWACNATSAPTIGTTGINFNQVGASTAAQVGAVPLNLMGATTINCAAANVAGITIKASSSQLGGTVVLAVVGNTGVAMMTCQANSITNFGGNSIQFASQMNISSAAYLAFSTATNFAFQDASLYRKTTGVLGIGTGANSGAATLNTGGLQVGTATKTTTYSALITDSLLIGDTTSAGFTITLPAASTSTGQTIEVVKKVAGNTLTVKGNSSDNINVQGFASANTVALTQQYSSLMLTCDGTAWWATATDGLVAPVVCTSLTIGRTAVSDVAYSILAADQIVAYTALTAARTATLPTAASVAGKTYIIKDESGVAGTNNITIATTSSQTIDGNSTATISTNYGVVRIYSNGSNWFTF